MGNVISFSGAYVTGLLPRLIHFVRRRIQHGLRGSNVLSTPVHAKLYGIQSSDYDQFPEDAKNYVQLDNNTIGVAFSGGGSRSHTLTAGYLRGLNSLKVTTEDRSILSSLHGNKPSRATNANTMVELVDYISCVSGGSWASSVYCFASDDQVTLLGKETTPEQLSRENLRQMSPGRLAAAITTYFGVPDAVKELASGTAPSKLWQKVVSNFLLREFDLHDSLIAMDDEHVLDIKRRNKTLENQKFKILGKGKPFLIINTTLAGPEKYTTGYGNCLQITPLYAGVPFYRDMRQMEYQTIHLADYVVPSSLRSHTEKPLILTIGGGVVETFALGSSGPFKNSDLFPKLGHNIFSANECDRIEKLSIECEPSKDSQLAVARNKCKRKLENFAIEDDVRRIGTQFAVKKRIYEEQSSDEEKESSDKENHNTQGLGISRKLRNSFRNLKSRFSSSSSGISTSADVTSSIQHFNKAEEQPIEKHDIEAPLTKKQTLKSNFEEKLHDDSIKLKSPDAFFTLQDAIGASSAAFVAGFANHGFLCDVIPKITYFPILSKRYFQFKQHQEGIELNLGDGGNLENTGLLSLLQRRVKRAICFINSDQKLDLDFVDDIFTKYDFKENKMVYECGSSQLLALFGCVEFADLSYNYTTSTVFQRRKLNDVMKDLIAGVKSGKGAVSRQTLEVLPNKTWNITGGFDVDIIFVYNERCSNFVNRLPKDTRTEVTEHNENGRFQKFPFYKTVFQNFQMLSLQYDEINLLSAQAEFIIKENMDVFKDFFLKR